MAKNAIHTTGVDLDRLHERLVTIGANLLFTLECWTANAALHEAENVLEGSITPSEKIALDYYLDECRSIVAKDIADMATEMHSCALASNRRYA